MTKTSKMYVLHGSHQYGHSTVLGVYSSEKLAQWALKLYQSRSYNEYTHFDDYEIETFDLDEEPVMV